MEFLYDKLKKYSQSGFYGFHMPGHKRNSRLTGADLPYDIDITEIEGFDDLHHARGILKEAQERAASLYHAEETYYLVNGSTAGLLSAILGSTKPGDRIIMARNCHKSVYNAVYINGLRPVYVYPVKSGETGINGAVDVRQIRACLEKYPDIRAAVITSPTYDGVVSDVSAISSCLHKFGIPLILDEAHGAHFGFHPYFPDNGNDCGADLVIHSLHKTLPSMTQTALLHMNGNLAQRDEIRRYLHMLQSSSPSYVLMASMDECVRLLEKNGRELFDRYVSLLSEFRCKLGKLHHLNLFETGDYDRSKILITSEHTFLNDKEETKKYTGKQLYYDLNHKYLLQMEMAALNYVIAITSVGDTREGFQRLFNALSEIDGKLSIIEKNEINDSILSDSEYQYPVNEQVFTEREMKKYINKQINLNFKDAVDCISTEYAYVYPPGIPLVVPGERISPATAVCLQKYEEQGFTIEGTCGNGKIGVIENG